MRRIYTLNKLAEPEPQEEEIGVEEETESEEMVEESTETPNETPPEEEETPPTVEPPTEEVAPVTEAEEAETVVETPVEEVQPTEEPEVTTEEETITEEEQPTEEEPTEEDTGKRMEFDPETPAFVKQIQEVNGKVYGFEPSDNLYITIEKSTSGDNGWVLWTERNVRFTSDRTPVSYSTPLSS
ncbi:MAG: hypothetical protein DRO11_02135 [Methanobacteriota archaeon]|nr:MAG: hypothetical protein DRO11_02135 [Euryarchaeota archaeon]